MNKGFQVGWWLAVATTVVMYAVSIPIAMLIPDINEYIFAALGELGIIIPILIGLIYAKKHGSSIKNTLGLNKFNSHILPIAIVLNLGVQYFVTYTTLPAQFILMIMFGIETSTSQMLIPTGTAEFLLAFTTLCIVAPVFEELLCRGVLIKLFERYGLCVSLLASSLIFAMMHFEARSFIPIFFTGLLYGVFRLCTGSVFLPIILHSINNFSSLLQLTFSESPAFSVITGICLVIALLFPVFLYNTFVKKQHYFDFSLLPAVKAEKTGFSLGAALYVFAFCGFNLLLFLQRLINGDCMNEIFTIFNI